MEVTPDDAIPTFWSRDTEWDAPCCMACVPLRMTLDRETQTYELNADQTIPESAVPLSDLI